MIRTTDPTAAKRYLAARARLMTAVLDGVALQIHTVLGNDDTALPSPHHRGDPTPALDRQRRAFAATLSGPLAVDKPPEP